MNIHYKIMLYINIRVVMYYFVGQLKKIKLRCFYLEEDKFNT